MKRRGGTFNAYDEAREASLKRLHVLYDFNCMTSCKDRTTAIIKRGWEEGGMSRWITEEF